MRVEKTVCADTNARSVVLVDDDYNVIEEVSLFLRALKQRGKSLGTIEGYARDLREFYVWLQKENMRFYDLRPRNMFSFIDFLDNAVGKKRYKGAATINRYLATLSAFYLFHESQFGYLELIDDVPDQVPEKKNYFKRHVIEHKIGPKQVSPKEFRRSQKKNNTNRLFQHEVEQLYDSISKISETKDVVLRNKLIFRVMYETGLRVGELLNLRIGEYSEPDPTEEFGYIEVVKREKEEDYYHPDHRCKTVARKIPVRMDLIFDLDDYVCNYRHHKGPWQSIFVNHKAPYDGTFMIRRRIDSYFKDLSYITGIKCNPHKLRHTHGTELTEAGYSELYLMQRLGHTSVESTKNYVHLSIKAQTIAYKNFIKNRASVVLQV